MIRKTDDIRIESQRPLISPKELKSLFPLDAELAEHVLTARREIEDIIRRDDDRLLAVVGPCSIHNVEAGIEYAEKLRGIKDRIQKKICLVMRVYFEKPRTRLGWRGMVLDPFLDESYDIEEGLKRARSLLLEVNGRGLAAGSEMLDPIVPQYIADLTAWAAIGARTIESPTHREMTSGLSMPVGFKNSTDGSIENAVNAMVSSLSGHSFIGIDQEGRTCVLGTRGNDMVHLILRGGRRGPNYHEEDVEDAQELLTRAGLRPSVIIDCSHANSRKQHQRQLRVLESVIHQRLRGNTAVVGFMLESNLHEGRQAIPDNIDELEYGVSITDACISWEQTEDALLKTYSDLD
jgi:3-deoxy-7-phosphoheptulonate synthase